MAGYTGSMQLAEHPPGLPGSDPDRSTAIRVTLHLKPKTIHGLKGNFDLPCGRDDDLRACGADDVEKLLQRRVFKEIHFLLTINTANPKKDLANIRVGFGLRRSLLGAVRGHKTDRS